ncbi:MAG TPA: sulfatase [Anaerolineales bacterium]|nr:sulfatase [Anaerolineales bacterium]
MFSSNKKIGFAFAVAIFIGILLSSCSNASKKVTVLPVEVRPNIILILADDLDQKLGTTDYMPNLKTYLIDRGTTIENFLITTPMCCPSRINLLRSQYTHNHTVFNNTAPNGGFPKFFETGFEKSTLPVWLQAAGYRTALIGKYMNAYPLADNRTYVPPGWSEWYSPGKKNAYDGFDYYLNENGYLVPYPPSQENFFTDVMSRKGVDFIERAAQDNTPFFLMLSTFAPHEPSTPAPRHQNLLPDISAPRLPSFNEEDVSDKSFDMSHNPLLSEDDIKKIDERYRQRVLSLLSVDEMIPEIIDVLKNNGLLENTYIIFTSDQGFTLGEHRIIEGKSSFFEEDIVVPFVVRGPNISEGEKITGELATIIDIAPTISSWAGVIPPDFVDGKSFAGLLDKNSVKSSHIRNNFLLEMYAFKGEEQGSKFPNIFATLVFPPLSEKENIPKMSGLRTLEYTYLERPDGFIELYNLTQDPYQLQNLASTASIELLEKFSTLLHKMENCKASECMLLDQEVVP